MDAHRSGQTIMKVPLNDLSRQSAAMSAEVAAAVRAVLESGWYVLGPQVEAFESEFAAYCGAAHCVGVGNGTDALELALRALEIGPGDQVAAVANAGGYATTAIRAVGGEPLYVDVEDASMNMDPGAFAAARTSRTRAVIATHLYGRMAGMPALIEAAAGIPVIEDCAQAHGAQHGGRAAGTWGALGCFSFYPTKNLGAAGDGGAVVTGDVTLATRVRVLRQYGWTSRYRSASSGGRNSRLDELQAAVLRVKLAYLEQGNARRREIAAQYNRSLGTTGLKFPEIGQDYVAHLYVARSPARDALREALRSAGIGSDIHYPVPDHQQESAAGHRWAQIQLPVTERCCREIVTLPCFPELRDDEIQSVAVSIKTCPSCSNSWSRP
jgi:dTDP-4-amino-4,6-dideoxygalactose transaminase